MIAYKGFNKNLTCTRGEGTFQYEVGKKYTTENAQCARTGFHCVEEPIEVLTWYSGSNAAYCIVEAAGDIHEDGSERISCTEMTIKKEITLEQLGILECLWIKEHPERINSSHVEKNCGHAHKDGIVVVRGKHPKASGALGSTLYLLQEETGSHEIKHIGVFKIDGKDFKPEVYYTASGKKARSY